MILDSPAGSGNISRGRVCPSFLGETENLLIEIGLLKRRLSPFSTDDGSRCRSSPAGSPATHRQLGAARLAVVADKVAVERQFYPLAFTTAFWKAALRLAYQPALKSAKRYNGAL